jgi:hypothetical protein
MSITVALIALLYHSTHYKLQLLENEESLKVCFVKKWHLSSSADDDFYQLWQKVKDAYNMVLWQDVHVWFIVGDSWQRRFNIAIRSCSFPMGKWGLICTTNVDIVTIHRIPWNRC